MGVRRNHRAGERIRSPACTLSIVHGMHRLTLFWEMKSVRSIVFKFFHTRFMMIFLFLRNAEELMGLWEYADRRKYLANDTIEMCQAAKVDGWLRSRGRYRLQENRDVGID